MFGPISLPESERDASGLTDRAYLDVLGMCVTTAIVAWLLFELALVMESGVLAAVILLVLIPMMLYLVEWTTELLRQTFIYAGTWRYGVVG